MRLHWLIKGLSIAFIGLLTSDSITLSKTEVTRHFEASASYLFVAADHQHPPAQFQAYQQSDFLPYLMGAAKQGHSAAAWQLYKVLRSQIYQDEIQVTNNSLNEDTTFWLNYLVAKDHIDAILEAGVKMVEQGQLKELANWLQQKSDVLQQKNLTSSQAQRHDELSALLELHQRTLNSPISSTRETQSDRELLDRSANLIRQGKPAKINYKTDTNNCEFLVATLTGTLQQAKNLTKQIESLSAFNLNQKYCFAEPVVEPRLLAICPKDVFGRASCQTNMLSQIKAFYTEGMSGLDLHWIVVTKQGNANIRDKNMFIDENDNKKVLIHELAHWSGLIDEYQLRPDQQVFVCKGQKPYWPGKNVLVAPKNLTKGHLEKHFATKLFRVPTCEGSQHQSYRKQAHASIMEYFDLSLTNEYQTLIFSTEE